MHHLSVSYALMSGLSLLQRVNARIILWNISVSFVKLQLTTSFTMSLSVLYTKVPTINSGLGLVPEDILFLQIN